MEYPKGQQSLKDVFIVLLFFFNSPTNAIKEIGILIQLMS